MRRRKLRFISPEKTNQTSHRATKGSRGGWPPVLDQALYRGRNVIERCFNRLKQFRELATGYAERAAYHRAEVLIAAVILWLR